MRDGAQEHPLAGVRVLDLSRAISGPFAGRILGDLGADVVRVDWIKLDITNLYGRRVGGQSGLFHQVNASKRGIAVDRRSSRSLALVGELAAVADVVIENFRPGVMDALGLGWETLRAANPGLVMLSISGFGQTGPEAARQAYAPVIHAESGLLARQSELDGTRPQDIALALADSVAALHGVVAIQAALWLRERSGHGQHIDMSMLEALVATDDYTHYSIDDEEVAAARGNVFDTPTGPVMVAADMKTVWARLARHAGLDDPPHAGGLQAKIEARAAVLQAWFASFTDREALVMELVAADLAWADLRTRADLMASPTLRAHDVVADVDDNDGGRRGVIRMPYRFSDARCDVRYSAPTAGRDTVEVLAEWLGCSGDRAAELVAEGAVAMPETVQ
jgi:CoA:oxalate CoA-transferase